MKEVKNQKELAEIIAQDKPVLLDFYADWCGPCQTMLPILDEVSEDLIGKAEVVKVNIDTNRELARAFGVRSIPALFFLKNEEIVDRLNGLQPKQLLMGKLKALAA